MKKHNQTIVEIKVNWNNNDSIKLAEKAKVILEDKGYKQLQLNHFGGINESVLVYSK